MFFATINVLAAEETTVPPTEYQSREVIGTVDGVNIGDEGQVGLWVTGDDGGLYTVDTSISVPEGLQYRVAKGDRVILQLVDNIDGTETAYFSDIVRTRGLWWAFAIFAAVIVLVGLKRGVFALVGFVATVGMLFWFMFPRILAGADPVLVAVIAGVAILAINLFLSHGFTRNAMIALASTSIGVVLAWGIGSLFVSLAKLSGMATDESVFLYWQIGTLHVPAGLLLAGIIIGTVGVLDDVAITQCETVAELKSANGAFTARELFVRAMRVGRHHIASAVNTLVLAYAGASLPLFLIFLASSDVSLWRFLNTEIVAEEIVRTLGGTTALVLIVPLATFVAALAWGRVGVESRAEFEDHEHDG